MTIEIKHKFTSQIILSGEYESIKQCLEKNGDAYLGGADLGGANLGGAYLGGAYLGDANLGGANLGDAYLGGANLRCANLRGANLGGANLGGANLGGANLEGAKNYQDSHDIFIEVVRRQKVDVFIEAEWSAIAQITIHRLCWDSIKKRFSDVMPHIFDILANAGFDEWQKHWNEITKED
jgi:hypothetical protein